ncbi:MAG: excinuclease ABC subunit UvrC [Anaerofustis sp.]
MNDILKRKIENLPEKPGVYLMKDHENTIIYVGKAKILKNRVRQYFQSQNNHTVKVRKMVGHIEDLEYIITDSEVEALMLECNLIKQHRPYYNILMKDDKSYPYLKLTLSEAYPKLELTRKRKLDGDKYFGPYVNAYAARKTLEAMKLFYPLKRCNKKISYGTKTGRVCLNYHLGQCAGVCQGNITPEEYGKYVEEAESILKNRPEILIRKLTEQMQSEADQLHFEAAGVMKEYISAVQQLNQEQKISNTSLDERDIIAMASDNATVCVQLFLIRGGKIIRTETRYLKAEGEERADVLASFMTQYYATGSYIPREIAVPFDPSESDLIARMLGELRGTKVEIHVPQKGDKKRLLDLAQKNAQMNIDIRKSKEERKKTEKMAALEEIARIVKSDVPVFRMEAYDISNIAGTDNVGVMTVFEQGVRLASGLRKFKIKTVEGQNDIGSMSEVVARRLQRAKEEIETQTDVPKFLPLPEVIFADGGLAHVNAIAKIVASYRYPISVAGLVKDNKHRLRAIVDSDGTETDIRDVKHAAHLLNEISEEVHRAAIGYHQASRSKTMLRSELESIEGIGKTRAASLLRYFGSLKKIKEADIEALRQVKGMSESAAKQVYEYYRREDNG